MKQAENLVPFNTDPQEDDGPQVLWDGQNLLKFNATNAGKYGRHIGRLTFTSIGQRNASLMVRTFCSRFKLSDVAMKELYTMLHCFLPPGNNLRSAFAAVNSSKKKLAEFETTNDRVCVLKFSNLIQAVVKRNFNSITNYNAERRANDHVNDIPLEKLSFSQEVDEIAIHLVLFTDGVTFIKSSSKKSLWPIWFSITQLQARLRMSRKNIVRASLLVGCKKPIFEEFLVYIHEEILQRPSFLDENGHVVAI